MKYYRGKEVPQDYEQAFKWFTKAEVQGNIDAQVGIAIMYYHMDKVCNKIMKKLLNGLQKQRSRSWSYKSNLLF
jgi:TPR repeat protein